MFKIMHMKKMNFLAALAVTLVFLSSCSSKKESTSEEAERIEPVKVEVIEKQEISRDVMFSTTLLGYETLNVAPSVNGKIERILVEVGSRVTKGQLLVQMDQNQYNTTKLAFANLGVEMARMEALKETGSISQQAYDQMKLSYDQTEESLDFLKKNTYYTAPFSGVITAKNYEEGELYGGQPILVLTQISTLKAFISVPESYFTLVKSGMQVELSTEVYPNKTFPAIIDIIYPTIDPTTHTFQVQLKIPNGNELLRPGMFARVKLSLGQVDAMIVPYQAVLKLIGSNDRYVFIDDNGVAKRVPVTLGQRFDDKIEILSPEITSGDKLVVTGQARLVNGVKLEIVD